MSKAPKRIVIALVAVVVLVAGSAIGRQLLGSSSASSSSSTGASQGGAHLAGPAGQVPSSVADAGQGLSGTPTTAAASPSNPASAANGAGAPGATGATASSGSAGVVPSTGNAATSQAPGGGPLPRVPTFPIAPQIVRTATIDLRTGKNALTSVMTNITELAATDGGYVESSSMGGGTARSAPVSGSIAIHVLDADFSDAMATLSGYGDVTSQEIQGKDVTDQVAANAATLQVLQNEVNLLQGKLAQATDINTFLQIQDQLFPVEQELQQQQNQQAVLENSAALATITTNLSAPGAPPAPAPVVRATANSATVAWRYLRHNSLAVLDGLAVGGGWALPVLALLALVWIAGTHIARRRRHAVNPA